MAERITESKETGVVSESPWERGVTSIQKAYEDGRAPEMYGTQKISPSFFDLLRSGGPVFGPIGAISYLYHIQKDVGVPKANPLLKSVANLAASASLALGSRDFKERSAGKSRLSQTAGEMVYGWTLGLLFFAQDGGSGGCDAVVHIADSGGEIDKGTNNEPKRSVPAAWKETVDSQVMYPEHPLDRIHYKTGRKVPRHPGAE